MRDLDTGDEEATAVPREAYDVRFGFAFADPYIAYHEPAPGNPGRIVVFDRVAGEEAYSVALDPWTSDAGWTVTFEGRTALTSDGTLAAVVPDQVLSGAETAQLITASVAHPAAKLLRTDVAKPFSYGVEDDLALAGDRVAVRRPGPKDYALVDLTTGDIAATVDRYEPNPCVSEGFGIDWDGTRLAWVLNQGIRNELYPTIPSTPGPPIDPFSCPTPNDGDPPPATGDPITPATPGPGSGLVQISTLGHPRAPAKRCRVPKLKARKLRAAKKLLKARHCRLGKVKRRGRHASVIVALSPKAGARRPAGTRVKITLGRRSR